MLRRNDRVSLSLVGSMMKKGSDKTWGVRVFGLTGKNRRIRPFWFLADCA